MKNLMIYIRKGKGNEFTREVDKLLKLQIDNSLDFWDKKDILIITNFPFKYRGIKALEVSDDLLNPYKPTASKINVITALYERGMITEPHWFHDLDVFQLQPIDEEPLKGYDLALTDYGRTVINRPHDKRWSTGVLFFDEKAQDIFELWKRGNYLYQMNEEVVLLELLKKPRYQRLKPRINRLNITYNLATRKRNILATYKMADKPLKAIHFHPTDTRPVERGLDSIDVCILGKGKTGRLVDDRFLKIFTKYYDIKQ